MKQRGWKLVIIILAIIAAIMTFSYFSTKEKEPLKIGFAGSLTGSSAELGVSGRNGVLLAADEINKAGGIKGRKVSILVEDDMGDMGAAEQADLLLIQHGATAIIGHMISAVVEKTIPLVQEKNILMISPTISEDELTGKDDLFFRVVPSNASQGVFLAEAARRVKQVSNTAIIYDERNIAYAASIINAYSARQEALGGRIGLVMPFREAKDYAAIIDRLRENNIDSILLIAASVDAGAFGQQLLKKQVKLPVFMSMWAMTNDLIKQGGPGVENSYLLSLEDLSSTAERYIRFRQNYTERYGAQPTFSALLGYEAAQILFSALSQAPDTTTASLKQALLQQGRFTGLQGDFTVDQYGDTVRPYYLYTIHNGAFVKAD